MSATGTWIYISLMVIGSGLLIYALEFRKEEIPLLPADLPIYLSEQTKLPAQVAAEKIAFIEIGNQVPDHKDQLGNQFKIAMLFFQLADSSETENQDNAHYSIEKTIKFLSQRGFRKPKSDSQTQPKPQIMSRGLVKIIIFGPDICPRKGKRTACQQALQNSLKESRLIYISSHRNSLRLLIDEGISFPDNYAIYFLDVCWSCQYFARPIWLASKKQAEIICAANRTVTGSVSSFFRLIEAVAPLGASLMGSKKDSWKNILLDINNMAISRANQRQKMTEIKPSDRENEVYLLVTKPEITN